MFLNKNTLCFLIIPFFLLLSYSGYGQSTTDSYDDLWKVIESEKETQKTHLAFLNTYIKKAYNEENYFEAFKALEKKTYKVSYPEAMSLINKMLEIAYQLKNDSLIEIGISSKTSFYYANRDFKEALNYAVQAESYNLKTQDLYQLSKTRIYIGNIYYHTKYYTKALEYFNLAKKYFEKEQKNYSHAYITNLYSINKAYWKLNEPDSLLKNIEIARDLIPLLNKSDQVSETAYIDYVQAGYYYLKKDFQRSEKYFNKALPEIIKNEDFTNEHVIYLYLGRIYWELNQKEKAVNYFLKIDDLFKANNFLNYELRDTYTYLIDYYKETNNPKKQLEATESLIILNNLFEKEQQYLTQTLHYELETKKLETSKVFLQKQLVSNQTKNILWLIVSALICILFLGYALWQNNQKKQWRLKFESLIDDTSNQVEHKKNIEPEVTIKEKVLVNEVSPTHCDENNDLAETNSLSLTDMRLLTALDDFELNKGFLKPLKLDDFAIQLNTNRNTLSRLLNTHKGGFTNYIGNLRIKQILLDLQQQDQLRKYSMQGLAETYGFANAKTFGIQFKLVTGLTPAYFIKQLEIDEAKSNQVI